MSNLIKINYENQERPTVLGRDLHKLLEINTPYDKWIKRMFEYGFNENEDYINLDNFVQVQKEGNREVSRSLKNHQLTIDMAKEIAMLQRTDKGKQVRQYFIEVEKQFNSPELVLSRALKIADIQIKQLEENVEEMKPKAEYFDALVDRNLLTNFRETAKEIQISPKCFVSWLINKKYIYRTKKGVLLPYEHKNNNLFHVKEYCNPKTNWVGVQTLITPKGREFFRKAIQED